MIFNRLVEDIREEPCLWSLKVPVKQEEQDSAWLRVAGKNKLSAVEVKLIFRELSKKYKEERKKPKSTWKLLDSLRFLDEELQQNDEDKFKTPTPQVPQQKAQPSLLRPQSQPPSSVEDVKFPQQKAQPSLLRPQSQPPSSDEDVKVPQQKAQQSLLRPQSQPQAPPSVEDVKVKDEPQEESKEGVRSVPHNTSEEDYVELLEVRDDDDFSEDEESMVDDDDMMDMDEDSKTIGSIEKKQTYAPPPPPSPSKQTTTPNTSNKSISVLNPVALSNLIPKSESTATSSTATSTTTTTRLSPLIPQRKIPMIFSGIKRKMSNGGGQLSINVTGKSPGQPPQKQPKTNQEKAMEKPKLSSASPVPERVAPTQQAATVPKDAALNATNVVNAQLPSPTKAEIITNTMNGTSIEIVRMETESGGGVNIGDVISMPTLDQIKVEGNDNGTDDELDRITLQNRIIPVALPSRSSRTSSVSDNEQMTATNLVASMQPAQHQQAPSTPHSRMYDSFGQYVATTLNALPERLANKLEIKVLEAIIAINTEKSSLT